MRILLDTHAVLWALGAPERLGAQRSLVEAPSTTRLLSAVVTWEVAIKVALGRLQLPGSVRTWAARALSDLAAEPLAIELEHAAAVAELPHHHRDPFDRLLVAQAQQLMIPVLTADEQLARYDVEVLLIP